MKPTLVIAGAGSGKTTKLVEKILECLPNLEQHRYLVAVTYTNSATDSILSKLKYKIKLPPNLFVGTTYAFFNKFLVLPFASLFPNIRKKKDGTIEEEYIAWDKTFFELDEKKLKTTLKAKIEDWDNKSNSDKIMIATGYINQLIKKGNIPFDRIASIASNLIKNNKVVRDTIGKRIQFLFVDEFQDATNQQFTVFDELRKAGKTQIYMVGDPEQFISNYNAHFKEFNKIPILKFRDKSNLDVSNTTNRRCSSQIVEFINKFNTQQQQTAQYSTVRRNGVFFIRETVLSNIVKTYQDETSCWQLVNGFKRFYLAYNNSQFDSIAPKFGIVKLSNDHKKHQSVFCELMRIITAVSGLSQKQLCETLRMNTIQLRTMAIKLWKSNIGSAEDFQNFFESNLQSNQINNFIDMVQLYNQFKDLRITNADNDQIDFATTIHKAKGLEAHCVLALARNCIELGKWLQTDPNIRLGINASNGDKKKQFDDSHRLGFVAFSRAKVALYIACLQPTTQEINNVMGSLNIKSVHEMSLNCRSAHQTESL